MHLPVAPLHVPAHPAAAAQRQDDPLVICPECDSVVAVPTAMQPGEVATCGRCGHALARFQGWKPWQLLAICLTAWIMLAHVLAYPLVTLDVQGNRQAASIWGSILYAWNAGHIVVGWMTFFTAVLLPVLARLDTHTLWRIAEEAGLASVSRLDRLMLVRVGDGAVVALATAAV